MIGVDTNVLVRVFARDDEAQRQIALRFLSERSADDPAFVSVAVVVETAWVLEETYGFAATAICKALDWLSDSANVLLEKQELLQAALHAAVVRNADISDSIIAALAADAGAGSTVTFDKDAAKRAPGMELLN